MARVTGSHLIGKALKLEGITNVFTLAGDHILPAMDAMIDMDFHFVDTRHEQAAVHMADGWSRTTGQLGVCMYTSPGFANAIPGLANALHSEAPLLSIAGCADLAELGRGAMQELDQVGMAAPITKGSFMVHDARRIPDHIARAVRLAFSGRRGPVHLTIPTDVQEQEVDEDDCGLLYAGGIPASRGGAGPAGTGAPGHRPAAPSQASHGHRRRRRIIRTAGGCPAPVRGDHAAAGVDRWPVQGPDFRRASAVLRVLREGPELGRQEAARRRPGALAWDGSRITPSASAGRPT